MITRDGNSIFKSDERHKFSTAMAEYLYELGMRGAFDRQSGDVECLTGGFTLFGRRILFEDSRGFVWTETFADQRGAEQVYAALEMYYYTWSDEDYDDLERELNLVEADRYLQYVALCAYENLEAFDVDAWRVNGKPEGPVG